MTLLYMKLSIVDQTLSIANAGHLPPVVRRGGDGTVLRIEEGINYPLGVLPETEYEATEFRLEEGDTLAVFTDGIIEAMNGEKEQYGFNRLEAVMGESESTPAMVIRNVLADVKKFVGRTAQSDDLTLVCLGRPK